jgi:hypothetical protein
MHEKVGAALDLLREAQLEGREAERQQSAAWRRELHDEYAGRMGAVYRERHEALTRGGAPGDDTVITEGLLADRRRAYVERLFGHKPAPGPGARFGDRDPGLPTREPEELTRERFRRELGVSW